jgi:dTDP-4-amino-4,6-dideoxygalactose transaminase
MLREYGWRQRFVSEIPGVNSRLDELQAAYLRLRLGHLEDGNRRRAAIAEAYDRGLQATGLTLPIRAAGTTHVFHQYVVRHRDRDGLKQRLADKGVATNIHYAVPVHCQPTYRAHVSGPGVLAATERVAREVLSLPMFPELEDAAVQTVIAAVRSSL